jgi:hypothetical protein
MYHQNDTGLVKTQYPGGNIIENKNDKYYNKYAFGMFRCKRMHGVG